MTDLLQVDDYNSYQLFKRSLVCAPMEDTLEDFYLALGATQLGSLVQDDYRFGNPHEKQTSAVKLRAHLLERSKLFLHESPRDNIKHDARWLDKNLSVQVVGSIQLRRSLRGHTLSHTEKRSAAMINERHKGITLYITPGSYDTYLISQSICKLLLERPSQQSYLTFETFLNFTLLQLRSRGYNVERILRAKAAEQRIAEEERKKQLEAEQKQIKEQAEQWRQQSLVETPAREERQKNSMPGSFGPDSPPSPPSPKLRSKGLFSGLTRRLGIDGGQAQQQLQNFLGGSSHEEPQQDNPPTYDEANGAVTKHKKGTEQVSSPAAVQQNLLNAIQSSRAHGSSTLFSPPTTQTVKEQASYCDSTPAQNITFLADAFNGTRIFINREVTNATIFLSHNVSALNILAEVLHEVAEIYNLPRKALHIFYDESGNTIAFNSNGSIFCNFRFFSQLHENRIKTAGADGRMEAAAYWWIVIAHELAHNLVKEHSSEHSFYT